MFKHLIASEFLLTPLAIQEYQRRAAYAVSTYKIVFIFGIKICRWSTN